MSDPTWVSVLPPVLAIVLAIWSRHVYLSLAAGILLGWTIVRSWNPLLGLTSSLEGGLVVLTDADDSKVILFTLAIGALITTMERSGGVRGFVAWLEENKWVTSARRAQGMAWLIGVVIFIESNITVLVAGSVTRPLFDRFKTSREKLAYLIDSTSAAVCILVPMNAWGAYNLGILQGLGVQEPLKVFLQAVVLNFYAIAAVLLAGATVVWKLDFGPMRKAEERTREGQLHWPDSTPILDEEVLAPPSDGKIPPRALNMVIPIVVMVVSMPVGLYVTGQGDFLAGSGNTSVLSAVVVALAVAWVMILAQRGATVVELARTALRGAWGLMPMAVILLLALSLADVAVELGTGEYVARVTQGLLPPLVMLPLVFMVSGGVAFSIGSSWSTFALMLPIAVPTGLGMGLPAAPFVAAVLSGGIFGDHSSPISDTTIVSSMAAATDHIDHVRTQLPYALAAGAVAALGFAILGAAL